MCSPEPIRISRGGGGVRAAGNRQVKLKRRLARRPAGANRVSKLCRALHPDPQRHGLPTPRLQPGPRLLTPT